MRWGGGGELNQIPNPRPSLHRHPTPFLLLLPRISNSQSLNPLSNLLPTISARPTSCSTRVSCCRSTSPPASPWSVLFSLLLLALPLPPPTPPPPPPVTPPGVQPNPPPLSPATSSCSPTATPLAPVPWQRTMTSSGLVHMVFWRRLLMGVATNRSRRASISLSPGFLLCFGRIPRAVNRITCRGRRWSGWARRRGRWLGNIWRRWSRCTRNYRRNSSASSRKWEQIQPEPPLCPWNPRDL